jgi:hypothetical protein
MAPRLCEGTLLGARTVPLASRVPIRPRTQFRTYKIIYRRYAGLFFAFCVDVNDNELSYLEGIHLFVEMLDRYFGNVCELDLVFNFHKVRAPRRLVGGGGVRQARTESSLRSPRTPPIAAHPRRSTPSWTSTSSRGSCRRPRSSSCWTA